MLGEVRYESGDYAGSAAAYRSAVRVSSPPISNSFQLDSLAKSLLSICSSWCIYIADLNPSLYLVCADSLLSGLIWNIYVSLCSPVTCLFMCASMDCSDHFSITSMQV